MDNTEITAAALPDTLPEEAVGVCGDNAAPEADGESLSALKEEIGRLKSELEKREKRDERVASELSRLYELFPEADISDIPEDVWEDVRHGNSLVGAYAIYNRKIARGLQAARAVNEKNAKSSAGRISGSASEYFTPDEVRAMSQAEVHANYKKILKSMPKWQ